MAARAGRWLAFVGSVLVLGVLGLRAMYSTRLGFVVADAIPHSAWRWLDAWYARRYGPADGEAAHDTELIGLGLVSLFAALLVVTATTLLVRQKRSPRA